MLLMNENAWKGFGFSKRCDFQLCAAGLKVCCDFQPCAADLNVCCDFQPCAAGLNVCCDFSTAFSGPVDANVVALLQPVLNVLRIGRRIHICVYIVIYLTRSQVERRCSCCNVM